MTEFDSSWPGWSLEVDREDILDRFSDPLGGLALVQTGVDLDGVFQTLDMGIDDMVGPTRSEAGVTWGHPKRISRRGNPVYSKDLKKLLGDQIRLLDEALVETNNITAPINEQYKPNLPPYCTISGPRFIVYAMRRINLRPSHTDFDIATLWLGSTRPGFKVLNGEEWLTVDSLPAGYALLWRGDLAYTDDNQHLSPIRHQSQYRASHRRVIIVGH